MKVKNGKVSLNIIINILLQISVVISGLIVPNLIIRTYGSKINGMITSINQLLSYITLLEAGIGSVVKAELYKPLVDKDNNRLNEIYSATQKFYSKIGVAFSIYLVVIAIFYNIISGGYFDWRFSASMVIILGINLIVQYFIGISNQTLLQADQQYWFTSGIQIITLWLNVFFTVILINFGASIQLVKLTTGIIFAVRPISYIIFAKKRYKIKRIKVTSKDILAQKWDGLGHHIAYFIHTNTDVVILTIFSTLDEVSVYSVYLMVVTGVRSLIAAVASALEPYFGRLIAVGDNEETKKYYKIYELSYYLISTIVFSSTLILIVPFVDIYTKGVNDANYHRLLFSVLLVVAEWLYCIRSPYSMMVFASGHFKQTRNGAFVEAGINIFISLIFVQFFGIIGVAIGTVVAMLFRTTQYVFYLKNNILHYNPKIYFVRLIETLVSAFIVYCLSRFFKYVPNGYLYWVMYALIVVLISLFVTLSVFFVFSSKEMCSLVRTLYNHLSKRKHVQKK